LEGLGVGASENHPIKYYFIWMQRDYKQQAKSVVKIQKKLHDKPATRQHVRHYEKQFKKETIAAKMLLRNHYPGSAFIEISFERLLSHPMEQIYKVAAFIKDDFPPLKVIAMGQQVVKRDPKCLEGFIEDNYM
jgi:hypothetical protein